MIEAIFAALGLVPLGLVPLGLVPLGIVPLGIVHFGLFCAAVLLLNLTPGPDTA